MCIWPSYLPQIVGATIFFFGALLASVTYRLVMLRETVRTILQKVDAHVMFVPKGQNPAQLFQNPNELDDEDPSGSIIH